MKTLERYQWRRSSFFIVNCKHISNFLLIIDFEQAKVCWFHIKKECVKVPMPAPQVLPLTVYIFEASYSTSATQAKKI